MKHAAVTSTPMPTELPALAVLGLTQPIDGDWVRLRALQYASLADASVKRSVVHGIAAVSTILLLFSVVNPLILVTWFCLLVTTLYFAKRYDRTLADADRRNVNPIEVKKHNLIAIAIAVCWVIPIGLTSISGDDQTRLAMWSIVAILMTASAIVLPATPISTFLFSVIVGCAGVASFALNHSFNLAGICLAFCATVIAGTIEAARNNLSAKIAEAGMAERNEVVSLLLREFEENEADWLWQVDPSRRVRMVSPRFAFALGADPAAIDGQHFIQLIAGPAWEDGQFHSSLHDLAERLTRRESFSNLLVRVFIEGKQRWWELSGTPKRDENGVFEGFRGVGSDVTEQRDSSDRIAYLARYDSLTGLPNRMMLTEALAEAMQYAENSRSKCAFLMIDLDRFKSVNDSLGHHIGDKLLALVSARLKEQMPHNALCGRLGGDEFAIVIRDVDNPETVEQLAQRVIDHLSHPYTVQNHTLYIGASIGSAIGPRDGSNVETLMRNADLALYRSKDLGGGLYNTYEPSLHAQAEEKRKLEFSLRRALENNEFALCYQPVVDALSEHIVSFEALIRWNSSEHGSVSPGKFIPLAEDSRLMVPIGEWVLREACHQAMHWPANVKVAVNVSGDQLVDPNFIPSVVSALGMTGLPAYRLEIEVTESIFLRDASLARSALEQIMALGCSVALDDFGTGYSSLSYIRNLCFTTIKVDRSFVVAAATGNRESLAIIRAVVAMAESLEMTTTAEGVETEAQLEIVRSLGCNKIQGYYYGRPMEAKDTIRLFQQQRIPA